MATEPPKKLQSMINPERYWISSSGYDRTIFKVMFSVVLVIYFCYVLRFIQPATDILNHLISSGCSENHSKSDGVVAATDLSHLVFGVAGSVKSWKNRRPYVDLWWRPNQTRGILWLDRAPADKFWSNTSPPYQVSGDISKFKSYDHHGMPFAIRMTRVCIYVIFSLFRTLVIIQNFKIYT